MVYDYDVCMEAIRLIKNVNVICFPNQALSIIFCSDNAVTVEK